VQALQAGRDVIVDNTNLEPDILQDWADLAARHGATLARKDFHVPLEIALARNAARERVVPPDVIIGMYAAATGPGGVLGVVVRIHPEPEGATTMSATDEKITEYTDPAVLTDGIAQGWADPETDPTQIDWPARKKVAFLDFKVVDGRPVRPGLASSVRRGRNGLGRWGENQMADALVTCEHAGVRHVLLVERADGHGWAVPGGSIDPGETPAAAAVRELAEETHLAVPDADWQRGEAQYVPDPRGSDEAWAVTVVARTDLGAVPTLPAATGEDDARRAEWVPAPTYTDLVAELDARYSGEVFPAHVEMLTRELAKQGDCARGGIAAAS
ncbi:MAG: NUDIX domain-containing protein, partial [Angustibacter sp.]